MSKLSVFLEHQGPFGRALNEAGQGLIDAGKSIFGQIITAEEANLFEEIELHIQHAAPQFLQAAAGPSQQAEASAPPLPPAPPSGGFQTPPSGQ